MLQIVPITVFTHGSMRLFPCFCSVALPPILPRQAQLRIDPRTLLPGATPFADDSREKAVSFDQPAQAKTLESLTKVHVQCMWLLALHSQHDVSNV